jgi:hypothetical protein
MPEWGQSGSVRGALSNGCSYRDASHFLLGFLLFGRISGFSLYQSATWKMSQIQAKGSSRLIAVTQLSNLPAPEQPFGNTQELAAMQRKFHRLECHD